MINLSTANAMTAYAKRYGAITMPAASNFFGKKQHVHAEMYLIFTLTGGDEDQIDGCMEGMHLVVDKPVCQQCYPYVKRAAPSLVDDEPISPTLSPAAAISAIPGSRRS